MNLGLEAAEKQSPEIFGMTLGSFLPVDIN